MGEHDLQVSLDTVRDKNVMQLKKLNCAIFPVTYQDKFYTDALTSGDFTKLALYHDFGGSCTLSEAWHWHKVIEACVRSV
jgi:hypothetical protein